ncbi:MAG: nucleotidyl transferase AbiEii/AbiGii toxin family protein [Thermoanaerobaculia bacterium]|nr:nucleotidyl transferase AbiEii/AbiGii toxin family protein [Thermoanaerobaculia bacterium]
MTSLQTHLADIAGFLEDHGVSWALIGGLAVSARTEPRFTRDIDIAMDPSSRGGAEDLVRELDEIDFRPVASLEQESAGLLATVRIASPTREGAVIDLHFGSSGIEGEIVSDAEDLEIFQDLTIPVARTPHLIALKVLSRDDIERPQDLSDLVRLLQEADSEDRAEARKLLRTIEERGFHRGRDLLASFDALTD